MSEKGKEALETIFKAIPKLSDFQRGRLLGMAEIIEEQNRHGEGEIGDSEERRLGRSEGFCRTSKFH